MTADDAHGVTPYDPRLAGAGVVDAVDASQADLVLATTADHTESLSVRLPAAQRRLVPDQVLHVTNQSGSDQTYDFSTAFAEPDLGVTIDINDGADIGRRPGRWHRPGGRHPDP